MASTIVTVFPERQTTFIYVIKAGKNDIEKNIKRFDNIEKITAKCESVHSTILKMLIKSINVIFFS